MKGVEIVIFYKDREVYNDVYHILRETNNDFVPPLTSKLPIREITDKYMELAHCAIAYVEGDAAGLVSFYPNKSPQDSYLSLICVKKEYRGLNIGVNLETLCIQYSKNYGSAGLRLNMRKSNFKLLESRKNMGYIITREYNSEYSEEVLVDLYLKF